MEQNKPSLADLVARRDFLMEEAEKVSQRINEEVSRVQNHDFGFKQYTKHYEGEFMTTETPEFNHEESKKPTTSVREDLLREAIEVTAGPSGRQKDYGDPVLNFMNIAALWDAYLSAKFKTELGVTGEDVCLMMSLFKTARTMTGFKRDNYLDNVNYPALAYECALVERDNILA